MKLTDLLRTVSQKTGAFVNIEALHPAFLNEKRLKLAPDQYIHQGEFCSLVKRNGALPICTGNKKASRKIAAYGKCFHGCCPNGIWELAFPVLTNGTLSAIVYLGHFLKEGRSLNTPPGINYSGKLPIINTQKIKELRKYARFIADFLRFELEVIEQEKGAQKKKSANNDYISQCMEFINRYYTENIALTSLAGVLNVNPNYLSGLIKKGTSKNFRELLNEKRIKEAEIYLRFHRQHSISEIAMMCGFNDSNYFSTVFKKITEKSPRQYRTQSRNMEKQ
ncbi:MAG: hypothetical protein A2017_02350 [Lentisphaerae bacterium GWF2_44_16]|nr:MAG: hypothetical protein A2017_02350 [Lentisphaerae bacterium GWF2_44_16]